MEVLIENRQDHHKLSEPDLKTTARRILSALGCPEAQLSIVIVDDDQIAELNQTYLNHTGPTNVISFPMQEGEFADITPDLLGDVVISADTAHREASDAGMPMTERVNQLLVHGILHLMGYDHVNDDAEAAVMEKKSNELLEIIAKKE